MLLAVVAMCGCDMPWDGPHLPDSGLQIAYTDLGAGPPVRHEGIYAATSISDLVAEIASDEPIQDLCRSYSPSVDMCWEHVADQPAHLYIAVPAAIECYRTVKETAVLSGYRLYFIYWIGKPQRACNLALAMPRWRLLSFSRSELPPSGTLTVDLQTQEDGQTQDLTTEMQLT